MHAVLARLGRPSRPLMLALLLGLTGCVTPGGSSASSQNGEAAALAPGNSGAVLRRVTLVVRELRPSLAFYRDALGMVVESERDVSSAALAASLGVDPSAKITQVMLNAARGNFGGQEFAGGRLALLEIKDPKISRLTHPRKGKGALGETVLAIRVAELAPVVERLKAQKIQPFTGPRGGAEDELTVFDPDGTRVIVYSGPKTRAEP